MISKINLILKKLDDWDEWIMIVKTITKRDDVEKYVNVIKIESAEFIELDFSIFFTIKLDATNSIDLSIYEQRDLAIMQKDYKKRMRKYKKRIDALKNLNIFIFISIDQFNLIYFRNQETIHQKLSALKKRLASTNRVRKLEIVRKYKNLQKALKHQQMNEWSLNWKKIYTKTKRLNLFDVQNDWCAYDFLNSLRTMNLSFVFERKTILNHEMNQKKIFDVNKKSFRKISKSFSNRASINHKKDNSWSICNFAKKNRRMTRLLIKKKNQRKSRIEKSRIDRVYVIKSIHSTNDIIWSKNFARLNENRTKKWWKKSIKFLKQT
jgi:hypothetical protein